MNRLPEIVRRQLMRAFSVVDSKTRAQQGRCGVEQDAQEKMRLYLDTWAVGPLLEVLAWDQGLPADEVHDYSTFNEDDPKAANVVAERCDGATLRAILRHRNRTEG